MRARRRRAVPGCAGRRAPGGDRPAATAGRRPPGPRAARRRPAPPAARGPGRTAHGSSSWPGSWPSLARPDQRPHPSLLSAFAGCLVQNMAACMSRRVQFSITLGPSLTLGAFFVSFFDADVISKPCKFDFILLRVTPVHRSRSLATLRMSRYTAKINGC